MMTEFDKKRFDSRILGKVIVSAEIQCGDNVLNNPKCICSELNSDAIRYLSSILGTKAPELNPLLEWMKKNSTDSWLIVGLFDANFSVAGKNASIKKLYIDLSPYILERCANSRKD